MRRTIAGVVLVLCTVACLCAASLFTILRTVDGMETLRMQSLERAGEGDLDGAEEYLAKLAGQAGHRAQVAELCQLQGSHVAASGSKCSVSPNGTHVASHRPATAVHGCPSAWIDHTV